MKALNTKGNSEYSSEIATTTKVNKIPPPLQVSFDPESRTIGIRVGATCLSLIAIVESVINGETPMAAWQIVETIPLKVSGSSTTFKESVIEHLVTARRSSSRALVDDDMVNFDDEFGPRVRVKLCLRANHEHCGDYTDADSKFENVTFKQIFFSNLKNFLSFILLVGPSTVKEASALQTPTVIAIVVSCIVFVLFVGLLLMFCRCKKNQTKKNTSTKDYDMDSVRPSIVAQQNQAPPPYYPASGLENKALEHSMDLALAMEDQKNAVYAAQNGYGYHPNPGLQVPGHTIPGNECKLDFYLQFFFNLRRTFVEEDGESLSILKSSFFFFI